MKAVVQDRYGSPQPGGRPPRSVAAKNDARTMPREGKMGDTDFTPERLLQQASGNQSAMFIVSLAWAKQRDGSVDGWAGFVGDEFAESWEELRGAGARDVAKMAGLNFASSADSTFVRLDGDAARAEVVIDGPDPEWLEGTGVTRDDSDRANELIFGRIAAYLGLSLQVHRDDQGLHLVFSRST